MLQDGTVYHGSAIGKTGTSTGEICFSTGMTGYQELFTDPSYFGQILVTTSDHIGNYGINPEEIESDSIKIAGLVCKNFSYNYSRKQATMSIHDYFTDQNVVGIADVDTRQIVRHIRHKGAMNCIISSEIYDTDELKRLLDLVPDMSGLELSTKVTTDRIYTYGSDQAKHRIAVIDYGVKKNILRCFDERDSYLKVFPALTSFEEMQKWEPDGYFVSNGPGDPAAMDYAAEAVKKMIDSNKPVFGICLGNQVLARACGLSTFKMHNGHRGLNHPVKNLISGLSEITTQNHGFAIDTQEAQKSELVDITHINLNDNTIEGIRHKHKPAFAVQYHPESSPGPHDSRYLFDDFVKLL
jgi:carbamoyl-phosphate synthase small subunit